MCVSHIVDSLTLNSINFIILYKKFQDFFFKRAEAIYSVYLRVYQSFSSRKMV